jgi:hypothetical protein
MVSGADGAAAAAGALWARPQAASERTTSESFFIMRESMAQRLT